MMKPSNLRFMFLFIGIGPFVLAESPWQPAWWGERNVITTAASQFINDRAPVNQGQVKWFAQQALQEIQEKLPGPGNSNIQQRVNGFTDQNNYLPVNIGQLKHVAAPCYDRLAEYGLAGSYPWEGDPDLANDYAIATVGQLKAFFSFELPAGTNLYYVATDGSDSNPGTMEQPFQTISHAANQVVPGGTVLIRGGTYQEQVTITNSGTAELPITIMAFGDESPRIIGAVQLNPADFQPVLSNDPVWDRLHPDAKGNVLKLDLRNYISDFGTLESREGAGAYNSYLELFHKEMPMVLARYPDQVDASALKGTTPMALEVICEDEPDISGVYSYTGDDIRGLSQYEFHTQSATTRIFSASDQIQYYFEYQSQNQRKKWYAFSGASPCGIYHPDIWSPYPGAGTVYVRRQGQTGLIPGFSSIDGTDGTNRISILDERITHWENAKDMFAMGFWKYLWYASHVKASSIDPQNFLMQMSLPPYGGFVKDRPFFVYNLLEELSSPREWYLDTESGLLYFWPNGALEDSLYVSLTQDPILFMDQVDYVTLKGITLEMTRNDLVVVIAGNNIRLNDCILRNCGGIGAFISGQSSGLSYCEVYNTGAGGIYLYGGERLTLTAGNNYVRNSDIHHFSRLFWTYRPGVYLSRESVGQIVEHNHIHDAPHSAIIFNGNNHRIAYNDIHDVCEWASDAGAIYGGRDWGARGNTISHNFIHQIYSLSSIDVYGIYMDDCISGITVSHNIFYDAGPRYPSFIGGGRNNQIYNNIFYGSAFALHVDNRGVNRIKNDQSSWDLLEKIIGYNYQSEPWSSNYPELAEIPPSWELINGSHWLLPEGCTFSRNLCSTIFAPFHEHNFDSSYPSPLYSFTELENNLEVMDPKFMDEKTLDLNLAPDSPAFTIPGFDDISFDEIGIQSR